MPRQNRVTPFGEIIAVPDRGAFMGNRGCLHGEYGQLTRKRWTRKAWVTCSLAYKGERREIMSPRQYTELFFLDEATALAAGHRPCAQCRRQDYERFKRLWLAANPGLLAEGAQGIGAIDELLHAERVDPQRRQRRWQAPLGELPEGTFVKLAGNSWPWLVWYDRLWEWAPGGYRHPQPLTERQVEVLTPASVTRVLRAGYRPQVAEQGMQPDSRPKTPVA